jgi:hypothetical protein
MKPKSPSLHKDPLMQNRGKYWQKWKSILKLQKDPWQKNLMSTMTLVFSFRKLGFLVLLF